MGPIKMRVILWAKKKKQKWLKAKVFEIKKMLSIKTVILKDKFTHLRGV